MIVDAEPTRRAWWLLLPAGVLYAIAFAIPLALVAVYSVARFKGGVTTFGFFADNYRDAITGGVVLPVLLLRDPARRGNPRSPQAWCLAFPSRCRCAAPGQGCGCC